MKPSPPDTSPVRLPSGQIARLKKVPKGWTAEYLTEAGTWEEDMLLVPEIIFTGVPVSPKEFN